MFSSVTTTQGKHPIFICEVGAQRRGRWTCCKVTSEILVSGVLLKEYTLGISPDKINTSQSCGKIFIFNSSKDGFISHFLKRKDHTDG